MKSFAIPYLSREHSKIIRHHHVSSSCHLVDEILEQIFRDIVKPTITESGYDCIRGDDIFSVNSVIEDIWSAICSARFLVGEFTGRNPNVLYEAGLAHTLGKPLICLTQRTDDIPFDIGSCSIYRLR